MLEELLIRSLADTMPGQPADGLFLFGQTEDNQASVFTTAKQLLEEGRVRKILFLQAAPMSGYPGFDKWSAALLQTGVPESAVEAVPVPGDTDKLHTLIEAEAMVKHASIQGYKGVIVTAAPFQQPRALMTAITAALRHYPQLQVYSKAGEALPWQEEVKHSQGKLTGTRAELIAEEKERIYKYHAKGDLLSVAEALDYLNKRDRNRL